VLFVNTNGATIPALGFGTYGMPRSDMLRMIPATLNAGVRHFDTAQIYRNEAVFERPFRQRTSPIVGRGCVRSAV
jgi:diketogulonate reductase-like aldo/keto reductase